MKQGVVKGDRAKGYIAWMASNRVAANILMLFFLIGGVIFASQVTQEVFPEFSSDVIQITVPYPGASPEEVEKGIVLSIENGVRGLEGVKRVSSVAAEGYARVTVELLTGVESGKSLQDVKNEVDRISSFPEDAERPVVSLLEIRKQVISLLVYGDQELTALRELAERVRNELISGGGVTLVELGLAPKPEISIEISQENLRRYDLTLDEVAQVIRRSALELPGGEVKTVGGQILLRTQERKNFGSEFSSIPVKVSSDGVVIKLGDIANIVDGFEETDIEAVYNGKRAIFVNVFRVGSETPQGVSKAIRDYIEELQPSLPEGTGFHVWRDSSQVYQDRMSLLTKNAAIGLTLVLVLLGLFLEPKLAFWVTLGIPISVVGCFLFIPLTGASINMISLFAFIVTLGIIVDDAVVMGENIYEKRQQGLNYLDSAIEGAKEVAMPITFAVLTNILAFLPLFFVPGVSGKFFRQIPAVVIGVFIISLIESIFILPAHLSHKTKDREFYKIFDAPRNFCTSKLNYIINSIYAPFVASVVRKRYVSFAVAVAALILAVGMVKGGHLKFSFLPKIDADVITAQVQLPFGSPMAESRKIQDLIIAAAKRAIERSGGEGISKGVYSQIGGGLTGGGPGASSNASGGSHLIAGQVSLVSSDKRAISGSGFSKVWREEIGQLTGIESLIFKAETGASEGAALAFNIKHRSKEIAETAAQELAISFANYAGVTDIENGVAGGKRQLSFKVTPEARSLGITASDLGRQVRSSFYGAEALRQQRERNEIKVIVRLPERERRTMETVNNLIVKTPDGGEMPFSEAAEVDDGFAYTEINRIDGNRIVTVTADVDEEVANANQITSEIIDTEIPKLQDKYPGLDYSFAGEQEAQRDSLSSLAVGFAVCLVGIYALLAVPFGSYIQPVVVMLSIPFGIIGAIGGHYLLGYGLSIISMFGIIALAGVVVNDSLVLVVTANRMRDEGDLRAEEAITKAGMRRFRPIILTSLTTFFGLAPMIFETSLQARFLIPMAISLGFGILFSTVIILAIVPAAYCIVEDVTLLKIFKKDSEER